MKRKISKDRLILIALIYNYLSKHETELPEWKTYSFIEIVKRNLESNNSEWEVVDEIEEEKYELSKYFQKDDKERYYKLFNLNNLKSWYIKEPKELIGITLDKTVLQTLYAENIRLFIPINKEYSYYEGTRYVHSLTEKTAIANVMRILEYEGAKDIKIKYTESHQIDGEDGYNVAYSCLRCYESLDLTEIERRLFKDIRTLESLRTEKKQLWKERKELDTKTWTPKERLLYFLGLIGTTIGATLWLFPNKILFVGLIIGIYTFGVPVISSKKKLNEDIRLRYQILGLKSQIEELETKIYGKKEAYHYIDNTNSYLVDSYEMELTPKEEKDNTKNSQSEEAYEKTSRPLVRKRTPNKN